ncbi:MAG: hypothetical protein J7M26_10625, partial [Armatimonadetes bacterium]|nr:hypothetical protein [Armatimonadota bacterium]
MPLLGGHEGDFRPVAATGVKVKLEANPGAAAGQARLRLTFDKTEAARRFVAIERPLHGMPSGTRALQLRWRLKLDGDAQVRPAILIFEKGGGAWYKVAAPLEPSAEFKDVRLSVTGLHLAGFSTDASGKLEFGNLEKLWLGAVVDGAGKGTLELSDIRLTSEPYKPSEPLIITGGSRGPGRWSVAKDPAVQAKLTTPKEGPKGGPCMKFDIVFPPGRHMYALPRVEVPPADLEGYRALRFSFIALLPPGIKTMLVSLYERDGSQYYVQPEGSREWKTVTIPFSDFKLGGWSRDEN